MQRNAQPWVSNDSDVHQSWGFSAVYYVSRKLNFTISAARLQRLTCLQLKNERHCLHRLTWAVRFSIFSLLACVRVEHIANPSVRVYFLYLHFFSHTLQCPSVQDNLPFTFFVLISELFFFFIIVLPSFGRLERRKLNLTFEIKRVKLKLGAKYTVCKSGCTDFNDLYHVVSYSWSSNMLCNFLCGLYMFAYHKKC